MLPISGTGKDLKTRKMIFNHFRGPQRIFHVINRQSFHWSMELHMPWSPLAGLALLIVAAAVATAIWSGRAAMDSDVVRAVREDW